MRNSRFSLNFTTKVGAKTNVTSETRKMPAQTSGRVRKFLRKRKFKKTSVFRLLATVMENQTAAAAAAAGASGGSETNSDFHNEFFNTGRIGRRNALPDILGYNCTTTTADLPSRLSALTTSDTPSTSTVSNSSSGAAGSSVNVASTSSAVASCSSSTQPVGESMNTT